MNRLDALQCIGAMALVGIGAYFGTRSLAIAAAAVGVLLFFDTYRKGRQ